MSDMTSPKTALVWFRNDLRLGDNPALMAAVEEGYTILPLYILDDDNAGTMAMGAASKWWLHHSLASLSASLQEKGCPLHLAQGKAETLIPKIAKEINAHSVFWNRRYEPWGIHVDKFLKKELQECGRTVESFNGSLLHEPWQIKTKQGGAYGVFTPFWKAELAAEEPSPPLKAPVSLSDCDRNALAPSDKLNDWGLLPTKPDWAGGLRATWHPGEGGARDTLNCFLEDGVEDYPMMRDRPDYEGTSRLSAPLHFGEISPRQIWHWSLERLRQNSNNTKYEKGIWSFLREIGWRDFNYNLLFHHPTLPHDNYQGKFEAFPWWDDPASLHAWQKGKTGYPMVDAGMRELYETGFMHNRVRMIVASFLVKHLLIHWRHGESWFRDTLVDADLASNVANWQWTAGCGADAAPYFRIFNPITQGTKFDPDGGYVRRWIPELRDLPTKYIHAPWTADDVTLAGAGVRLGKTYPHPIVDHKQARQRALDAYQEMKGAA